MILDATILAVDTAQVSGWAIWCNGNLVVWGEIDMLKEPEMPLFRCQEAIEDRACGDPCVLVYEKPLTGWKGRGQGLYQGNWRSAWVAAGGVKSRTLGVLPATWRRWKHA